MRREDDRIGHVADADALIPDIVHQPAAARIGLDANAVLRTVDGQVPYQHVADAAASSAADGHAVSAVEVVVQHGNVRGLRAWPRPDGDAVIAGVDVAMSDRDIRGR